MPVFDDGEVPIVVTPKMKILVPICRDPERIDRILDYIRKVWHTYPDLRLTQLICNVGPGPNPIYHVEDTVIERKMHEIYDPIVEDCYD